MQLLSLWAQVSKEVTMLQISGVTFGFFTDKEVHCHEALMSFQLFYIRLCAWYA